LNAERDRIPPDLFQIETGLAVVHGGKDLPIGLVVADPIGRANLERVGHIDAFGAIASRIAAAIGSDVVGGTDKGRAAFDLSLDALAQKSGGDRARDEIIGAGIDDLGDNAAVAPPRRHHDDNEGIAAVRSLADRLNEAADLILGPGNLQEEE